MIATVNTEQLVKLLLIAYCWTSGERCHGDRVKFQLLNLSVVSETSMTMNVTNWQQLVVLLLLLVLLLINLAKRLRVCERLYYSTPRTTVFFVFSFAAVFNAVTSQLVRNALLGHWRRTLELVVGTRHETRCPSTGERAVHTDAVDTSINQRSTTTTTPPAPATINHQLLPQHWWWVDNSNRNAPALTLNFDDGARRQFMSSIETTTLTDLQTHIVR